MRSRISDRGDSVIVAVLSVDSGRKLVPETESDLLLTKINQPVHINLDYITDTGDRTKSEWKSSICKFS